MGSNKNWKAGGSRTENPDVAEGLGDKSACGDRQPPDDLYLSLRGLSGYAGLSVRKLRDYLVDPGRPLPHYRIGGKLLVRRSEYDAWARAFQVTANERLEDIVDDVVGRLGDGNS